MAKPITLDVARGFAFDASLVTKTTGILAQRRKGKTYTACVIGEEMCTAGLPWAAIDPTGAWWGLRAAANGKDVGLPVTILGGQHGDVPLDRSHGKLVADLVVEEPGWYVIDLSLLGSKEADRQFATDFAERLYRRKGQPGGNTPMHVFVDEADIFVPQRLPRGDERMLGAFETLVRRGGLRGIGTTLISQRAAVVNKNVLEQLDVLVILRTVGPNDRKAVEGYVKAFATETQLADVMGSLASLAIGEAWVYEPGEDMLRRVKVRARSTFNSSATPEPGKQPVEPRRLADVDLDALKERMAAVVEKQRADDPATLRARIAELEREVDRQRALQRRVEVPVEVPIVPAHLVDTFAAGAQQITATLVGFRQGVDDGLASVAEVLGTIRDACEQAAQTAGRPMPPEGQERPPEAPRTAVPVPRPRLRPCRSAGHP